MSTQEKSLQDHLGDTYDVDIEAQLALRLPAVEALAPDAPAVVSGQVHERFIVDNDDKAQWALRKLAQLQAELDDVEEQVVRERRRIDEWHEAQLKKHAPAIQLFESMLLDYHRARREADPKCKTINLPAGTLHSRATKSKAEIEDVEAFIAWAKDERPDLLRTKLEVEKAKVNDAVCNDGEVLPHVSVVAAEVRYSVEVTR